FNQPMDRAAVERGVTLRTGGASVPFATAWADGDTTLTLTPAEPLAIASTYEVSIPAGLAGAAGGETQADRTATFQTLELPRLLSSSPRNGEVQAGRYGISLEFNNPMDLDSLED